MEDIKKIVRSLEESDLLIKDASETIENEAKSKKDGFFGISLDTLSANLLGTLLAGKRWR